MCVYTGYMKGEVLVWFNFYDPQMPFAERNFHQYLKSKMVKHKTKQNRKNELLPFKQ